MLTKIRSLANIVIGNQQEEPVTVEQKACYLIKKANIIHVITKEYQDSINESYKFFIKERPKDEEVYYIEAPKRDIDDEELEEIKMDEETAKAFESTGLSPNIKIKRPPAPDKLLLAFISIIASQEAGASKSGEDGAISFLSKKVPYLRRGKVELRFKEKIILATDNMDIVNSLYQSVKLRKLELDEEIKGELREEFLSL